MATGIMATSTTKLTHSILLGSFVNDIDFFAEEKLCCNLSRFDSIIFFMVSERSGGGG